MSYYYVIITSLLRHYYVIITVIMVPLLHVIMAPLLPIITKSIMGNNGSIITHYEPDQLADAHKVNPSLSGEIPEWHSKD